MLPTSAPDAYCAQLRFVSLATVCQCSSAPPSLGVYVARRGTQGRHRVEHHGRQHADAIAKVMARHGVDCLIHGHPTDLRITCFSG